MPAEHLDAILHAAQRAPTDATAQMYSLIRLSHPGLKQSIAELSGNPHIVTASEAFLVCGDIHRLEKYLQSQAHDIGHFPSIATHFAIGDAALAGQNLLLAAEMLGYRGCWIGGVMNALHEISALVELPKGVIPYAALTIGIADEAPIHRPRLPREQVIHENRYKTPEAKDLLAGAEQMASISPRGNWVQTLARYFAKNGSMETREQSLANFLQVRFGKKI